MHAQLISLWGVARRWLAEYRRPPISHEELAEKLAEAVTYGEFEFPLEGSEKRPPNFDEERGVVIETFNRHGRPFDFRDVIFEFGLEQNELLDAAKKIHVSMDGLSHWVARPEFGEFSKATGLLLPTFINTTKTPAPHGGHEEECQKAMTSGRVSLFRDGDPLAPRSSPIDGEVIVPPVSEPTPSNTNSDVSAVRPFEATVRISYEVNIEAGTIPTAKEDLEAAHTAVEADVTREVALVPANTEPGSSDRREPPQQHEDPSPDHDRPPKPEDPPTLGQEHGSPERETMDDGKGGSEPKPRAAPRPPGRKRGDGAIDDTARLMEMAELIATGRSSNNAANEIAIREATKSNGEVESKAQERVRRRLTDKWGKQQAETKVGD
jgi:hypothetical protein